MSICANNSLPNRSPRRTALAAALLLACVGTATANEEAAPIRFNASFLTDVDASMVDRFQDGNPVDAGTHMIDIQVNGRSIERRGVRFNAVAGSYVAQPCITADMLRAAQVRPEHLQSVPMDACIDLAQLSESAAARYDTGTMTLNVSLPQSLLANVLIDAVPAAQIDHGISAGFITYAANTRTGNGQRNTYLGINAGANLGAWRLRHRGSWTSGSHGHGYQRMTTILERPLLGMNSHLVLGETNTSGRMFPSTAITGAQLSTDERMLPEAQRGYAPVVRGSARTNARVTILQKGYVLYEIDVAPGPFEITDLAPASYSGDLDVIVAEADGTEQHFTITLVAAPLSLRQGSSRFELAAGQVQGPFPGDGDAPWLLQGGYARGINNMATLMGGVQASDGYQAMMFGGAFSTRMGSIGLDATFSRTEDQTGTLTGSSLHASYQHHVERWGTNFGVAAYRYNTEGFRTLEDASRMHGTVGWAGAGERPRHRFDVDIAQRLGDRHSLFARSGIQTFWNRSTPRTEYQAGIQGSFGRVSYSLSASRTHTEEGRRNDSVHLGLQIPLGRSVKAPSFSVNTAQGSAGGHSQASLSGSAGADRQLTYQATLAHSDYSQMATAFARYRSPWGNVSVGLSSSAASTDMSVGVDGSVVVHSGGINVSSPVGETFGLINADGATGGRIGGGSDRIAGNGFGVVTHLTPYRWNNLSIDPLGVSADLKLLQSGGRLAPSAGAVTRMSFETRAEMLVYVEAQDVHGEPLGPFGADVRDQAGASVGLLGQGGVIHLNGASEGELTVSLGSGASCTFNYSAESITTIDGVRWTKAMCRPVSAAAEPAAPMAQEEFAATAPSGHEGV